MQIFRFSRDLILLVSLFMLTLSGQAQMEATSIQKKKTLIIPKIDAYWSSVVIAENFPSFFPLELEVNLPGSNISFNGMISPWASRFSSQTQTTRTISLITGLAFRYYFHGKDPLRAGATGFFIEPELFVNYEQGRIENIGGGGRTNNTRIETALMLGGGYQHAFWDRVYLQGRLSVGLANTEWLESYTIGRLMVLPWVGVGIRLN